MTHTTNETHPSVTEQDKGARYQSGWEASAAPPSTSLTGCGVRGMNECNSICENYVGKLEEKDAYYQRDTPLSVTEQDKGARYQSG